MACFTKCFSKKKASPTKGAIDIEEGTRVSNLHYQNCCFLISEVNLYIRKLVNQKKLGLSCKLVHQCKGTPISVIGKIIIWMSVTSIGTRTCIDSSIRQQIANYALLLCKNI